ncbi:MAG: ShlB/FhaC/HecB family hemolysin secretion/activation protein [Nitrosomonadales bacterium]|nr:ShlB/FhaC/HecB family hemolysin secretion/activation protein [Nitrosomonadales bacterium]
MMNKSLVTNMCDARRVLQLLLSSLLLLSAAEVSAENAAAVVAEPVELRFDIGSVEVEGATLLAREEIDAAVAPFIGKSKDFSDVQRALEAVEDAYAKRGYTAVRVMLPEQELENGRVRFRAVESHFGQIVVTGQKFFSEESVRNALPSVRQGVAPRSRQIARELKLANENPSRQLNVVMKASPKEDVMDAEVKVVDKDPAAWGVSFDNTGSGETGRTRLGLFYRHASLMDSDHQGTVQMQVSPQHMNRVRVFGGSYKIPLYESGDSVEFFGGYSNVNSVVGGLSNFQGGGILLNAHYNQALEKIAGFDPRILYGFDWRDFKRIEQTEPKSVVLYNEIVVTPLSLGVVAQGRHEKAETNLDLTFAANVPMSGKGKKEQFAAYDPLGILKPDVKYRIVRYGLSHMSAFGDDWQARAALTGQWTRNILVLGEQMRLGGMNAVRGFTEGSEAGESGARWTLEGYSPAMSLAGTSNRVLAFFDGGSVRAKSGVSASIGSYGLGLRTSWQEVSFRMDAARIRKEGTDPLQKKGDWRIHAAVSATF